MVTRIQQWINFMKGKRSKFYNDFCKEYEREPFKEEIDGYHVGRLVEQRLSSLSGLEGIRPFTCEELKETTTGFYFAYIKGTGMKIMDFFLHQALLESEC